MGIKVGINGFGRIGRNVFRANFARTDFEIVAVNDITTPATLAHLLKYDSVHGRFGQEVKVDGDSLNVGGKKIRVIAERDPGKLPWKDLGVDVVLECSGLFTDKAKASAHISAGAKKVIISAPAKGADLTVCFGVNHTSYNPAEHHVLSNASCTTNCLAPVAKVLDETFGIKRGLMTTVHAYTNDQRILDLPHEDIRRARAAALSMIPTTTGAARAVGEVLPQLKGKLDGMAIRVPTPNVSVVDLSAELDKSTTKEEINAAIKAASEGALKGVLGYSAEELVSIDFNGSPFSSIFDAPATTVMGGNFIKILSWYDNEWGFSNRMGDVTAFIASSLK